MTINTFEQYEIMIEKTRRILCLKTKIINKLRKINKEGDNTLKFCVFSSAIYLWLKQLIIAFMFISSRLFEEEKLNKKIRMR